MLFFLLFIFNSCLFKVLYKSSVLNQEMVADTDAADGGSTASESTPTPKVVVRRNFPETFIFSDIDFVTK
jgi:hypothetical protein